MNNAIFDTKITFNSHSRCPGECTHITFHEVVEKLRNGFWQLYADTCASLPKDERQEWKANNAPLLVMAASLKYRNKAPENVISHSGLVCLDIDGVEDITDFKLEAMTLPYVVLICKSISGTGIFCVVHIPKCDAGTHRRYYIALQEIFKNRFGSVPKADDAPKCIASARYVSYDPGLYVNYDAEIFDKLPPAAPPRPRPSAEYMELNEDPTKRKVSRLVNEAISRGIDITSDYGNDTTGYNDWLCIAGTLSALFGETARGVYHQLSALSPNYSERKTDAKFTEATKKGFAARIGSFINICKKYGLDTSNHFGEHDRPLVTFQNSPERLQVVNPCREAIAAPIVLDIKPIEWSGTPAPLPAPPPAPIQKPVTPPVSIPVPVQTASPVIWTTPKPDGARFPDQPTQRPREGWGEQIQALKSFFNSHPIPASPVKFNAETTITDPAKFITGHLAMIQGRNGNQTFRPYLDRLHHFKTIIQTV